MISTNQREARVAAVQSSARYSWRNRATPNDPADRGQDNVTRYIFRAPASEAQYHRSTPEPVRISVTALFSSCWWFSRQSGFTLPAAGPFSEHIQCGVLGEGCFPFRPSLLLFPQRFPPLPEAGFSPSVPGCRFGFLRKSRKAYQYGNPPRIDTARAFGAQSVNNMDTPRHG